MLVSRADSGLSAKHKQRALAGRGPILGSGKKVSLHIKAAAAGLGEVYAASERRCRTRAGAIYARNMMDVSGGSVSIRESTASGGRRQRGSGSLSWSWNRDEGSPRKKWHAEQHGLCSFGRRVLRVQGVRGLQADAARAAAQQVISNV